MKDKILIVDDDKKLTKLLDAYLTKYGLRVITANHPSDGLKLLGSETPDLVILDVMMPDQDGFEVCRIIRQQSNVPIIMLTARGDVHDRIVGLEIGADDYMPKPFEPRELLARIQSVLRRGSGNGGHKGEILKSRDLVISLDKQQVLHHGKEVVLTSTEFSLLVVFMKNAGKVLDRDKIMIIIRGLDFEPFNRSIDVLISRLRNKLKDDPKKPKYFKTVWGSGYMFIGD